MTDSVPAIRDAKLADEPLIIELWRACNLIVPYNDPGLDFRNAVTAPASTVLVAEDIDGSTVGSIMVGSDGHRGWLYYVACMPTHRGRGPGTRLVEAGERWLADRQVPKAQLIVRETNTDVVCFYGTLGYEIMPRHLMGKWLKSRA